MRWWVRQLCGVWIPVSLLWLPGPAFARVTPRDAKVHAQLAGVRVPFLANEGQVDAQVAYYAPTFAGTVFVTRRGEVVYALRGPSQGRDGARARRVSTPRAGWSLTETLPGGRRWRVYRVRSSGRKGWLIWAAAAKRAIIKVALSRAEV